MVRVEFETDSQLLADALDLGKVDFSAYSAVIEDMKYQLKLWFSKFTISVCRRSANSVAHELANLGRMCEINHCMQWNSDVPAHVGACVSGDMPSHR